MNYTYSGNTDVKNHLLAFPLYVCCLNVGPCHVSGWVICRCELLLLQIKYTGLSMLHLRGLL